MHVWGWNSRSSVIKNRKSFHLVRVFSRQWWLINFRMHRSDDCRSWNFITNINRWAHVSFSFWTNKQTNSLLSPDTIQWTRGQNIKQIHRYRRQKLDIYNINTYKLNTLKLTRAIRNLQQYTNRVAWLEQRHVQFVARM